MNNLQRARILNLGYARMLDNQREFVKDLEKKCRAFAHRPEGMLISEKQHLYLAKLAWRYRKQLPASCVPKQDPAFMSRDELAREMAPDLERYKGNGATP